MYELDLLEDVDNVDDLVIGCGYEYVDFDIFLGNLYVIIFNDFLCNE